MRGMNQFPAGVAAAAAGTALALGVAGCGGSSKSHHTEVHPHAALAGDVQAQYQKEAEADCAQPALTLDQYQGAVGDNAMQPLSFSQSGDGLYEFKSNNPEVTAQKVAKNLGTNTLGLSIIYTIEEVTKTKVNPYDITEDSKNLFNQMMKNPTVREKDCVTIDESVLTSPEQVKFTSATGHLLEFQPVYKDGVLSGLNGQPEAASSSIPGFNIAPIEGSSNYSEQHSLAQFWIESPQGGLYIESLNLPNSHASNHGQPEKVTSNGDIKETSAKNQNNSSASSSSSSSSSSSHSSSTSISSTVSHGGGSSSRTSTNHEGSSASGTSHNGGSGGGSGNHNGQGTGSGGGHGHNGTTEGTSGQGKGSGSSGGNKTGEKGGGQGTGTTPTSGGGEHTTSTSTITSTVTAPNTSSTPTNTGTGETTSSTSTIPSSTTETVTTTATVTTPTTSTTNTGSKSGGTGCGSISGTPCPPSSN
jgi:hypothetical protein